MGHQSWTVDVASAPPFYLWWFESWNYYKQGGFFFFFVSLVPGRIDYASMGFDRICLSSVTRPNTTLGPAHLAQLPAGWAA
jgi:hypothetical protein